MSEPIAAEAAGRGRLAGRVTLVTGASRGIGRAVARRFAAEGAELVLVARTQAGLEELDDEIRAAGRQATLVPADLNEYEVIDRIGAAIFARWGRLDVLVGCAGSLGTLGPLAQITPEEWQQVLGLNLTANWRLIRSCDPLLRASPSGRVIFVTSGVAGGRAYWGTYAVSKAGLETLARTYAAETMKTGVRVNLIDPGPTRTRMRAAAYPGEDPQTLKPPEAITEPFVALAEASETRSGEIIRL